VRIVLVPIGRVDPAVLQVLQCDIGKVFNVAVAIGQEMPEPAAGFNAERGQYLSTAILGALLEQTPYRSHERKLGIVDRDLYVPGLNFVFGQARQAVAVISLTRLRQEFYGLPEDRGLFLTRALTEAVHELGHSYGLGHCDEPRCVMAFSNSITDTDRKGAGFCRGCTKRLFQGIHRDTGG
jgi:archaemetzincin